MSRKKKMKPKPKKDKKSWQKRNEARKVKQDTHAAVTVGDIKASLSQGNNID